MSSIGPPTADEILNQIEREAQKVIQSRPNWIRYSPPQRKVITEAHQRLREWSAAAGFGPDGGYMPREVAEAWVAIHHVPLARAGDRQAFAVTICARERMKWHALRMNEVVAAGIKVKNAASKGHHQTHGNASGKTAKWERWRAAVDQLMQHEGHSHKRAAELVAAREGVHWRTLYDRTRQKV